MPLQLTFKSEAELIEYIKDCVMLTVDKEYMSYGNGDGYFIASVKYQSGAESVEIARDTICFKEDL